MNDLAAKSMTPPTMATRKPRKTRKPPDAAATTPSHADIAARAYARFLARGAADGRDCEDWLEAERELQAAVIGAARRSARSRAPRVSNRP